MPIGYFNVFARERSHYRSGRFKSVSLLYNQQCQSVLALFPLSAETFIQWRRDLIPLLNLFQSHNHSVDGDDWRLIPTILLQINIVFYLPI